MLSDDVFLRDGPTQCCIFYPRMFYLPIALEKETRLGESKVSGPKSNERFH
jgi:hypothetical protein